MNLDLGCTRLIIEECKKNGLLRNQAACVLANTYHESAHTMKPVREYGGETYLKSKAYYPFVGMGLIQLTWERNFRIWSKRLGVDFISNPKLLLEPKYAVQIAVEGMKDGSFTGKKLSDFVTLDKSDFFNARSIVNGDKNKLSSNKKDKIGDLIAGYAKAYDADLLKIGYGLEEAHKPTEEIKPISAPEVVVVTKPSPEPPVVETTPIKKTSWIDIVMMVVSAIFGRK